jgi:hypothetical protein
VKEKHRTRPREISFDSTGY